jgi:hypothetical protein
MVVLIVAGLDLLGLFGRQKFGLVSAATTAVMLLLLRSARG